MHFEMETSKNGEVLLHGSVGLAAEVCDRTISGEDCSAQFLTRRMERGGQGRIAQVQRLAR